MIKTQLTTLSSLLLPLLSASALTLEVDRFENGMEELPFGYQEVVQTGIDQALVINVSEAPYVDYLIPNNQGNSGVTAQKQGGQYIVGTNAADPGGGFLGANNWPDPDRWHPVFEWTDGLPLPFGSDYWGVSHSGWSADQESNLITRINLATTEEVTVYHWFNDGWDYDNHYLDGHVLSVTQYNAAGTEIDSQSVTLPGGGADAFFGDHRQFYASVVKATATAEGDYLILQNKGANIGYKGTAVAILEGGGETLWNGLAVDDQGFADSGTWFNGFIYITDPSSEASWIYAYSLTKYVYVGSGGWVYIPQ